MIMVSALPVRMLLVEDNDMDVRIFKRAMRSAGVDQPLCVAHDGVEALAALRGTDGIEQVRRPNIIVLDLNMPRMNGIEFLEALRADPSLADLVVFVLTTSDAPEDKRRAYERHVAGYVVKSISSQGLVDAIKLLDGYSRVVDLPN
jgi:CheY-like chemotaxis protein